MTFERYNESILARVTDLERALRAHIVDLDESFSLRDWAAVARIYREIAGLADELERLDPNARSRVVELREREQAALDAAFVTETDELDELARRGEDAAKASEFLDPERDL